MKGANLTDALMCQYYLRHLCPYYGLSGVNIRDRRFQAPSLPSLFSSAGLKRKAEAFISGKLILMILNYGLLEKAKFIAH